MRPLLYVLLAFMLMTVSCGNAPVQNAPEPAAQPVPTPAAAIPQPAERPTVTITPAQQPIASVPAEPAAQPTAPAPQESTAADVRVLNGVIKTVYGPKRDRGEVQSEAGKYYNYYNQPGFAYGDTVSFSLDQNGYAIGIKLVQEYAQEQRTQYKIG